MKINKLIHYLVESKITAIKTLRQAILLDKKMPSEWTKKNLDWNKKHLDWTKKNLEFAKKHSGGIL